MRLHNSFCSNELRTGGARSAPSRGSPPRGWSKIAPAAVIASTLACVLTALPGSPALADGVTLAAIKEIDHEGLYRETFTLKRDAAVEIEAVGSGWPDEDLLFSYAWVLDLNDRTVAWEMLPAHVREDRHDNVEVRQTVQLKAGDYALYFSALGGYFPIKKEIKILKLFELGTFNIKGGTLVEWDRYGQPSRWKAVVRASDPSLAAGDYEAPARPVRLPALLAFREAASGDLFRAALEVRKEIRVRILAVGEYVAREQGFADGAWIEDLDACERAWDMTLRNTKPAGGAKKNRMFDDIVSLAPGRYLVCYSTDDSHSFADWNAQPPYDPESWGITILPAEPIAEDAIQVATDPSDENLIARIDRVGDNEFHRVGFTLREAVEVCVRGFGEWGKGEGRLVDFGWIEDARTLDSVWSMEDLRGMWAAGEPRNRVVLERLLLDAGDYYLCYTSDYAHSYPRWSDHPPYDPKAWGISLRALGRDVAPDLVTRFEEEHGPVAVIRLAPIGDDERRRVRFAVAETMRVKVLALGEGARGEMYDFGWLRREDTNEVIWKMEFEDTFAAGGAKKNRRVEDFIELQPGEYSLYYRSDGSHSFEGWNAEAPSEPHLWGVTLIEWTSSS